jgi:hypothetical protein
VRLECCVECGIWCHSHDTVGGVLFSWIIIAALVFWAWRGNLKKYQRSIVWAVVIILVVGWLLRFAEINGYSPLQILARELDSIFK